jgi:hypothetical protein
LPMWLEWDSEMEYQWFLIGFSFIAKEVEHLFMYILDTWISSSEKCQQTVDHNVLVHLALIGLFVLCCLVFWALCIFCILTIYLLNSWGRFSPILWVISWFW